MKPREKCDILNIVFFEVKRRKIYIEKMAFFGFFNFLQKHMHFSTTNKKLKFYHQNLSINFNILYINF